MDNKGAKLEKENARMIAGGWMDIIKGGATFVRIQYFGVSRCIITILYFGRTRVKKHLSPHLAELLRES